MSAFNPHDLPSMMDEIIARSERASNFLHKDVQADAERLAVYPDLVKMLQRIEDRLWEQQSIGDLQFQIAVLLDRTRSIK